MDGYQAYKFYLALKLHFSSPKFDVFKNKGVVKYSRESFNARNDRAFFEKLASKFSTARECILFMAANFMYKFPEFIYSMSDAEANYKEFVRRRQSRTKLFRDDLDTIINARPGQPCYNDFSGTKIPFILQLWLSGRISIETLVILNDMDGFTDKLKQSPHINLILGDDILRIEKARGFVKYDPNRVMADYLEFLEQQKDTSNG